MHALRREGRNGRPTDIKEDGSMTLTIIARLLGLAREYRRSIIAASVCAVCSALLGTLSYLFAYRIIVAGSPGAAASAIPAMAAATAVAVVLRYFLLTCSSHYAHNAAFNTLKSLRVRLVEKLGTLPMGYFIETDSGVLNKIVGEDVEKVEALLAHHIPDVVSSLATPVILLVILAWYDPFMALCTLCPVVLAFYAQRRLFALRDKNIRRFHDTLERVNTVIIEFIRCLPAIKAFNRSVSAHRKYTNAIAEYVEVTRDWSIGASRWYALFKVALGSGLLFIVPPGVYRIVSGSLSPQELTIFLLLGLAFTSPLDRLIQFSGSLNQIIESVRRIDGILNTAPLPTVAGDGVPDSYDVAFENVHFSFGDKPVFTNASFQLRQGTMNAFVGRSGAGKSTAAQLIARFYDPAEGRVTIGGKDIRSFDPATLNSLVSVVFQQTFLFSDTIENNIRAGNTSASFEQVREAARAAHIEKHIESLPDSYQTVAGSDGVHMSGGERQRIAIARAILKNAPILLLDEATAFADPENEERIQHALAALSHNKTVIVIAHRLPTITDAEQILFFGEGRILASGTHEEMLASCHAYAELWARQNQSGQWLLRGEEKHV